MSHEAKDSLDL